MEKYLKNYRNFLETKELKKESIDKYILTVRNFLEWIEIDRVDNILSKRLAAQFARRNENSSYYTQRSEFYIALNFIRFLVDDSDIINLNEEKIKFHPIDRFSFNIDFYTIEEAEELLRLKKLPSNASKRYIDNMWIWYRDLLIVRILLLSGIKSAYLFELKPDDLFFEERFRKYHLIVNIPASKVYKNQKKTITLKIAKEYIDDIYKAYINSVPFELKDHLIITSRGKKYSRKELERTLKNISKVAGVDYQKASNYRHTFAIYKIIKNNVSVRRLMEIMGYRKRSSAKMYFDLLGIEIKEDKKEVI